MQFLSMIAYAWAALLAWQSAHPQYWPIEVGLVAFGMQKLEARFPKLAAIGDFLAKCGLDVNGIANIIGKRFCPTCNAKGATQAPPAPGPLALLPAAPSAEGAIQAEVQQTLDAAVANLKDAK